MSRFDHAYSIGFSVQTEHENPRDVPAHEIREALKRRLDNLPDDELVNEAIEPFDTFEIEEPQPPTPHEKPLEPDS